MTQKHTPGPWLRIDRTVYALHKMPFAGRIIDCNRFDVCVQGNDCPDEEKEANARLIAAAPELLTALEWAVARLIAPHSGPDDAAKDPLCIDKCKEIISKATGAA